MKKLKKYDVNVKRRSWGWTLIEVMAKNRMEAREKALNVAGNYLYPEKDADYEVDFIHEVVDSFNSDEWTKKNI